MTAPDPQTAADAAERVQRWLDEWSFKVQGNHVVTGCGRDEPDGCTELTAPDIDALLRDRVRLLAELEQVRGEREHLMAWLDECGYDAPWVERRLRKAASAAPDATGDTLTATQRADGLRDLTTPERPPAGRR